MLLEVVLLLQLRLGTRLLELLIGQMAVNAGLKVALLPVWRRRICLTGARVQLRLRMLLWGRCLRRAVIDAPLSQAGMDVVRVKVLLRLRLLLLLLRWLRRLLLLLRRMLMLLLLLLLLYWCMASLTRRGRSSHQLRRAVVSHRGGRRPKRLSALGWVGKVMLGKRLGMGVGVVLDLPHSHMPVSNLAGLLLLAKHARMEVAKGRV